MHRASGGAVYENATRAWEESGGRQGFPPVPEYVDADLADMAVARRLGIPAPLVRRIGSHWYNAALVEARFEQMLSERDARKSKSKKR